MPDVESIKEDISTLFSDMSVSQSETRSRLEDIQSHIEIMLDSLPEEEDEE